MHSRMGTTGERSYIDDLLDQLVEQRQELRLGQVQFRLQLFDGLVLQANAGDQCHLNGRQLDRKAIQVE